MFFSFSFLLLFLIFLIIFIKFNFKVSVAILFYRDFQLVFFLVLRQRMIAFFEVALRLQNAQTLPLDSWKAVPAPESPDAATRAVQRWSFISNLQHGCTGRVTISVAHF